MFTLRMKRFVVHVKILLSHEHLHHPAVLDTEIEGFLRRGGL